jgi:hypothetical protein
MEHIRAHLSSDVPKKRKRLTERGEMMRYFKDELNKTRIKDGFEYISMPRMGKILEMIPTSDLYYLKSVCDEAARRGNSFSKRFWWELDPKKHQEKQSPSTKRRK